MAEQPHMQPGWGGEWRRETETPSIGALSEAVIDAHGGPEHYVENSGRAFRDATWNDPEEYGKYYLLEQHPLLGVNDAHRYSLRVYGEEGVREWYRFQTYDTYAATCDAEGRIQQAGYHELLDNSRRARSYLKLAAVSLPAPTPILAPRDIVRGAKLTELENDEFIRLAAGHVLELIDVGLVLKRVQELPKERVNDEGVRRLTRALQRRPPSPSFIADIMGSKRRAHLRLPQEWIPRVVDRALFGDELDGLTDEDKA